MNGRIRIERPSDVWQRDFLRAALRSQKLHRPWVYPPCDASAFSQYVGQYRGGEDYSNLLIDIDSNQPAGVVNVSGVVRGKFQSGYLGYYAFVPFQGCGRMRIGLSMVITDAFRRRGLHRLEANIQPDNKGSIGLVKRLGFRLEGYSPRYLQIGGRWRDHERWAILKEDWRP